MTYTEKTGAVLKNPYCQDDRTYRQRSISMPDGLYEQLEELVEDDDAVDNVSQAARVLMMRGLRSMQTGEHS
ncbi:MAG: hypothetical protein ABEI97_04585 [Candidatus Nanohaloarchaea archaeon]